MDKGKEKGGFVRVLDFVQMYRINYIVVIYCRYEITTLSIYYGKNFLLI